MTRRERLERRLAKRREWAEGRDRKAADLLKQNEPFRGDHAFNTQPGHIPERARAIRRSERAGEHYATARHHDGCAAEIERALDRSVFSDDADAIEQLEARIAEREANRERGKRINAAWRRAGKPDPLDVETWSAFAAKVGAEDAALVADGLRYQRRADMTGLFSFAKPYDPTYDGAKIRRDRERIEEIKRRQQRTAAAEQAGGVEIARHPEHNWCRITFAEKPERSVLDALKAAGYRWGKGSWQGYLDRLPEDIAALE